MKSKLEEMRDRYHSGIPAAAKAILDAAQSEDREPTEDELDRLEALEAEQAELAKKIEARLKLEESRARFSRPAKDPGEFRDDALIVSDEPKAGPFRRLGEQLVAIAEAARPGGRTDDRLFKVVGAASGASASVGADGAFLIQKDFSTALLDKPEEMSVLWPATFPVPIGPNSDGLEAPAVDETSRATGSRWGGVRVYRVAEAETVTATKPKVNLLKIDLEDLMALFYATDRLLRDASALGAIVEKAFRSEFGFVIDDEIFRGTGVGQCLGIMNSAALVSVAKESGQAAATFVAANAAKMFARMPARLIGGGVWYINQDVLPQLVTMTLGDQPIYLPAGTIANAPYGLLLGRPVAAIEQAETLGTKGDVLFANLQEYITITKDQLESADSIHVRFLYNERTFRWTLRMNGAPAWKSNLTPYKGTAARSPFVVLDTRS